MEILKNKELITALMFTMYQNALTRERQEKLDMATLLLYRLLEMIEQRRLSGYDLFVSEMRYLNMKPNIMQKHELKDMVPEDRVTWLKSEVFRIKGELFKNNKNAYLPDQVSLLEGFIILEALGDPITNSGTGSNINLLRQIRSKVLLRNNSIFAHGLGPVRKEDYDRFRDFVTAMFKKFCDIEKIDFDGYSSNIQWLNPADSENYVSGQGD